jgi:hypothetical protein
VAIKISNSTIIDDGRNIVNAGITTVTSVSIGNTEVISASRQLKNITSLDATTTSTIETAIANAPNTFTDLNIIGIATFSNVNVTGVITSTTFSGTATSTTNIPNLSGDISSNNTVTTLATVNSNVGTFGDAGAIPRVTVNGKGLVTGVTTVAPNNGSLSLAVSGTGLSGSATFTANQSGNSTFTVTSNATSANTNNAIVARNGAGGFSAGVVTATTFSGNLQNTLTLNTSGTGLSGSTTFNNSGASTFTVTSNATSANTNSTIVSRDGAGGFVAGIVTATFVGNITGNVTGNLNSTGVNTATTISGTTATYTNISGTDLNYTGISTVTNVRSTTLNNTGVGTITTLNSTTGTVTNLSGTNLNYTGIGTITNITNTNINTSGITTTTRLNVGTGGTIITTTTGGFVGINSTIPGSTLAVGGTITELFNGTYWNIVSQADVGYGASQIPLNQYLGQLAFLDEYSPSGLRRTGGGFDDVVVNANGFVGIATTNPTSQLHIIGNGLVSGVVTASNFFRGSTPVITGIGIGSTSINPGSGAITNRIGFGFTDISIVGGGVSVVGYGNTLVVDFNGISKTRTVNTFTATQGQTTFTVSYVPGFVDVYLNGVFLTTTEFTATNGTSVILGVGANAGDILNIITYQSVVAGPTTFPQTLNFVIDGYGSTITTGKKGVLVTDCDYTVTGWTIIANQSGSIVVDVKRSTYANYPTTSSIAGSELPTLTSAQKNEDLSLTTWTTSLSARDIIEFEVNSVTSVTRATVALRVIPR